MNKYIKIATVFFVVSCKHQTDNTYVSSDNDMASTINIGATITYKKTDKINRNDIVIFNSPGTNQKSCLRVAGLPGEKIEIKKGVLLINDKEFLLAPSSKMVYTVYSKSGNFSSLQKYNFKEYSDTYGMVGITKNELDEIINNRLVDSIYLLGFDSNYIYPQILKESTSRKFNHYYFGPIFIPSIGDTLYKKDEIMVSNFLNFSNDYLIINEPCYFCIGDSFTNAMDSRVIGIIPKSAILGKLQSVRNVKVIKMGTE